jgi:hypothetical protein
VRAGHGGIPGINFDVFPTACNAFVRNHHPIGEAMTSMHPSLAEGRWFTLTLCEQLGNIGSEVYRAIRAGNDTIRYDLAVTRALELFDLTLADPRWRAQKRLKEIARARELFCDSAWGTCEYQTSLEDLDTYFTYFALAARQGR